MKHSMGPRLKKWTPVIVRWEDAVTVHDPMHSDDLDDANPVERTSIGFLVRKNAKAVTICMEDDRESHDPDRDCQTVTSIGARMVIEVIPLELAEKSEVRNERHGGPSGPD